MITRFAVLFCALALGWTGPTTASLATELRIGITQFPSTLNPLIDSMLAKSYVLAMTRRPITAYDQDWELVCMLCTELPTIENGLAVPEDLPDGKSPTRSAPRRLGATASR
jgi:peptide/nickel transport system substrate-binding protein